MGLVRIIRSTRAVIRLMIILRLAIVTSGLIWPESGIMRTIRLGIRTIRIIITRRICMITRTVRIIRDRISRLGRTLLILSVRSIRSS